MTGVHRRTQAVVGLSPSVKTQLASLASCRKMQTANRKTH